LFRDEGGLIGMSRRSWWPHFAPHRGLPSWISCWTTSAMTGARVSQPPAPSGQPVPDLNP